MTWQNANILHGISQSGLEELSQITQIRDYTKDSFVISEEDKGCSFFIVDQGSLHVKKGEHKLAIKKEGDHFGLMALFEETSRSADVIAITPCTLAEFNWNHIKQKISDEVYQTIITNHFKELQSNLRSMNQVFVSALIKNEALIDQVYSIREKLSSDLHDDVGSLLAGLSMQSELLILQGVEHMSGLLEEVGNISKEAMERMRDIVWAVDSRKDKYENLILKMKDFTSLLLMDNQFKIQFNNTGIDNQSVINPTHREHIYFIFKEALNNIKKHSTGDQVWIDFHKQDDYLVLNIKDNGTKRHGHQTDGCGLSNMQMRADKLGGELEIRSGELFEIRLRVAL